MAVTVFGVLYPVFFPSTDIEATDGREDIKIIPFPPPRGARVAEIFVVFPFIIEIFPIQSSYFSFFRRMACDPVPIPDNITGVFFPLSTPSRRIFAPDGFEDTCSRPDDDDNTACTVVVIPL